MRNEKKYHLPITNYLITKLQIRRLWTNDCGHLKKNEI
jgi:hypothetical protein